MSALLSVANLAKNYQTRHGVIRAVADVSFDVALGEIVALVGESGCGKSTVALTLLRLIEHDGGQVVFDGMDLDTISSEQQQKLRQDLSIVFQNPYSSLNPRMRIRDIVGEPLRTAYGLRGRELTDRVKQHLGDVGLGAEHMKRFPHEFSGGQRQRIAIARALALEPKLLILDEPTAALDVSVQAQVLNLLRDLQRRLGLSYLVISHNLATVESIADRVLVMYFGKLVETGPVSEVFARPLHPYTRALLDSVPSIDPRHRDRLKSLEGEIPSPLNPPPGCSFAPRCAHADAQCSEAAPILELRSEGRQVACYNPLVQDDA
ncbi:MAG: oligopeptide/dipeptide ABC transporter ATP-binding protein [Alphaproteobacteria bacterium]